MWEMFLSAIFSSKTQKSSCLTNVLYVKKFFFESDSSSKLIESMQTMTQTVIPWRLITVRVTLHLYIVMYKHVYSSFCCIKLHLINCELLKPMEPRRFYSSVQHDYGLYVPSVSFILMCYNM